MKLVLFSITRTGCRDTILATEMSRCVENRKTKGVKETAKGLRAFLIFHAYLRVLAFNLVIAIV